MADFWPLALFLDRLHCGGGAAMTAQRARCVLYQVENRYRRVTFLCSYFYAVNVTNVVRINSDCYEQFRKSKFIHRHVSVDRFLTCGYTCSRVTSKKILAASVALEIRKRL